MIKISFRQGLLAGFAAIVLLLGGSALNSWLMLEGLIAQTRIGGEQAIDMSAAIQELDERTVDVERSARQYLVLEEVAIRQQFEENLGLALVLVSDLEKLGGETLKPTLLEWRQTAQGLRKGVNDRASQARIDGKLATLNTLNTRLQETGKRWIDGQNARLIAELEKSRWQLGMHILLAAIGAALAALAMGWWLVRPLRQLEAAIVRLGASRFEQPVEVGGPDDLQHLGERLDWLRQRLAELEADRERSLRHVSHELKTPLTALKEGIALMADEVTGPLDPRQREVVDILGHNVLALQRQIESLLSLNAASFEARRLNLARVDLRPLLAEVVEAQQLHSSARGISVQVASHEAWATVDREKLAVILDNLLSNAIGFSPDGGRIELRVTRIGKELRFECIDQGPGIDPEDRERIFEPFVQGRIKAPAPRQGSGVGLSIVRELTAAMNGRVSLLDSACGAHFCVDLPDEK